MSLCSPQVVEWRAERARDLGFDDEDASAIAEAVLVVGETRADDAGIDLHSLERLIAAGCPPVTARRILL